MHGGEHTRLHDNEPVGGVPRTATTVSGATARAVDTAVSRSIHALSSMANSGTAANDMNGSIT
ncbi:hypothetical protein GCM10029964_024720 [Kibdelosporangium lantanae]